MDVAERVEGTTTVVVRRGVNLTVREAGKESLLVAYRGDTVEQVLLENSIVLKDADEITPARETVVGRRHPGGDPPGLPSGGFG